MLLKGIKKISNNKLESIAFYTGGCYENVLIDNKEGLIIEEWTMKNGSKSVLKCKYTNNIPYGFSKFEIKNFTKPNKKRSY